MGYVATVYIYILETIIYNDREGYNSCDHPLLMRRIDR